jgi:hypothetical protein
LGPCDASKREANPVAINRLLDIGREIAARVEKLDKIGVKAVDHVDSINHLLAEAEKLCETAEAFKAFKQNHCPNLGRSRTYELLAIEEGRKSLDGIRALTRARVAKHRAAKSRKPVTDKPSVTLNGESIDASKLGTAARSQITDALADSKPAPADDVEAEAAARKALYAESEPTLVPAEQTTEMEAQPIATPPSLSALISGLLVVAREHIYFTNVFSREELVSFPHTHAEIKDLADKLEALAAYMAKVRRQERAIAKAQAPNVAGRAA